MERRHRQNKIRSRRATRIRSRIRGTAERPRLSVFRSNQHTYAQVIDDQIRKTLVSVSTKSLGKKAKKGELATALGEAISKKAITAGIRKIVFDKGPYAYHGRVRAVAEAARKAGLQF